MNTVKEILGILKNYEYEYYREVILEQWATEIIDECAKSVEAGKEGSIYAVKKQIQ